MYTIVICILIGVVVGIGIAAKGHYDIPSYLGPITVFGLFGLMIGLGTSISIGEYAPASTKEVVKEMQLVSLRGGESLAHGNFFLGCGSIKEKVYYFYYYKDKEGDIHFGKMSADNPNIIIREKDRVNPVLRISKTITTHSTNNWILSDKERDGNPTYIFIVPKGTIKRDPTI